MLNQGPIWLEHTLTTFEKKHKSLCDVATLNFSSLGLQIMFNFSRGRVDMRAGVGGGGVMEERERLPKEWRTAYSLFLAST